MAKDTNKIAAALETIRAGLAATRAQIEAKKQELDRVRVKGKEQAVAIFWPMAPIAQLSADATTELKNWVQFVKAYRSQNWDQADVLLINLMRMNAKKFLYQLYAERLASMRLLPFDPQWDGATNFETK